MTDEEVASLGCIICREKFGVFSPAEVHHLRQDTGIGRKAEEKIGLCALHHRLGGQGVAFHAGKKSFEANFGTQSELYEKVVEQYEKKVTLLRSRS